MRDDQSAHDLDDASPPPVPSRLQFLPVLLALVLIDTIFWSLAAGLGWGFGLGVAQWLGFGDRAVFSAAAGVGLVVFCLALVRAGKTYTAMGPFALGACGGMAVGAVTVLAWTGSIEAAGLGGFVGFGLGTLSTVVRQAIPAEGLGHALLVGVVAAVLVAVVVTTVEGLAAGPLAGGLVMLAIAVLAPPRWGLVPPREPGGERSAGDGFVAGEEPPRLPWFEAAMQQVWRSLNVLNPFEGRVWKGALAGLFVSLWGGWAGRVVPVGVRYFAYFGLFAIVVIVAGRFAPSLRDESGGTASEGEVPPVE